AAARASFAPGSGKRSTAGGGVSAGSEAPWAGVQLSKSMVSNTRPARVRAYSRAPSGEYQTVCTGPAFAGPVQTVWYSPDGEYQTVCTGPVAGEANPTSIDGLPTRRHSTG